MQQLTLVTLVLFSISEVVCQPEQVILNTHDYPNVTIYGSGPSQADLNETVTQALGLCQVRDFLNGTRHRVLSSEFLSESVATYSGVKASSEVFRATVYDYTHGRTILINGIPFDMSTVFTTESNAPPISSAEELADAASIAGARPNEIVRASMPPVITRVFPDGTSKRILNIAINSAKSSRIVFVDMNNRSVEFTSHPSHELLACNAPLSASGSASDQGLPGTASFIISQGVNQLWTFQAIRPSASSGLKGSGIELRNVKYKGRTVLFQAHVPILNVEYEQMVAGCGPHYRDWQYDEFYLQCEGTDITPGFRLCNSPAKTILDSPHVDGGDFRGVAVYVEGQEVVLKAQLIAGWYRYISEWRFNVNGELKPRWGFGGVLEGSQCVCQIHHHHVYWRLDFDIGTAGNNIVREFNKPPIMGSSNYDYKLYEIKRPNDAYFHRHWEILNTRSEKSYALIPGSNDGESDAYGVGDLWVLRYHADELDDGVPKSVVWGSAAETMAHIDKFINGELVRDKDVVLWYAAHFKHDQNHGGGGGHIVGPTIRPLNW
jgi:hypothetical protein